jgi:hypothetical protein
MLVNPNINHFMGRSYKAKATHLHLGPDARLHRVYLAGKISHTCWRHKVIPNFPRTLEQEALSPYLMQKCKTACGAAFWYTGPYFVSCDHGCAHAGMHGAGFDCMSDWPDQQGRRDRVHRLNAQRLERSTGVFVYLDELDCYGSLAEIGHAYGQRIPIGIAYGPSVTVHGRNELWFVERFATWVYDSLAIEEAFAPFLWSLSSTRPPYGSSIVKVAP